MYFITREQWLSRKVHQRYQFAAMAEYISLEASHDAHGSRFVVCPRCSALLNMTGLTCQRRKTIPALVAAVATMPSRMALPEVLN